MIPLWRDAAATRPNVTGGLLEQLDTTPERLFAYCYAMLAAPSYAERFSEELEIPGPHVPITKDRELFDRAAGCGEHLIRLHTYQATSGEARCTKGITEYPESHSYDPERRQLLVGDGVFEPVSSAVRGYSVSGLDVIGSWLDYRMRAGAGRRSSHLDAIRPVVWLPAFTEELLRLLWIVEQTVALGPDLDDLLDEMVASDVFTADELPKPSDEERESPQ